jgi:predicted DNA-binding protein (UPF0251 family)
MKERLRCRCTICELEKSLLDELRQEPNVQSYRQLASESSILSAFPTAEKLLGDLGGLSQRDRQIHLCDQVLGELLRMGASCNRSIACQLILLILLPAMHKTARQIATGFRSLASEEIAQHVVTTILEIIESKALLRQQSHFAFRIARLMRRRSFCWALRESKKTGSGDLGILAIEAGFTSKVNLESVVILRKFLGECIENGWLTPAELELLMLFKVEGVGAEVLAVRMGISEIAFRHRMQRLIERLRRIAKQPSPIAQRKSCSPIAVTMIEALARGASAA